MRVRLIAFTAVCVLGAGLAACARGSSAPKSTPTPSTPSAEDVIGAWVKQNRNIAYIGDCSIAKQGVDVGKLCVTALGQRGTRRAYGLGPTFSDPTALAMVEQQNDGTWKVLSVTNDDPTAGEVPGIAWPLEVGDRVVVVGLSDCLSVRDKPTQLGKRLACEPLGTVAIIQDGPIEAENFTWWKVSGAGPAGAFEGWAVDKYLRLPDAIAQVLQPKGTPTSAH